MATRKILVTGATGGQGGGVARHLLRSGKFAVRCLARHPDSEKAKRLAAAGAEVFAGELSDPASIQSALRGCWGAFGVTNYWEHFAQEAVHGRNFLDATAAAGTEFIIFSSLPHVKKQWGLDVPHFDIKAQLQDYATARKLPAAFIHAAFYYENFLTFFPPRRQADGSYVFGFPQGDTPLAGVAVEDIGGVVAAMFANAGEFRGKTVGVVGDDRPPAEYAEILSRATGRRIAYSHVPRETFASLGFAGAEDLANMFEFNRLHIPNRASDVATSLRLYPQIRAFEPWAQENRSRLLAILDSQGTPARSGIERPAELHRVFAQAFNARDLEKLLGTYEPAAKLVMSPQREVVGQDAIRSDLERLLAGGGTMQAETTSVVEAGDVAVTRGHWTLQGTAPDGKPLAMEATSVEVLRRQADGSWRVAIDCPFAGA